MLIRQSQIDALQDHTPDSRDDDLYQSMVDLYPWRTDRLGEPPVRAAVVLARHRAARYTMISFEPVRAYLECMFRYGSGFDADPQLPWASATLTHTDIPNELTRARSLLRDAARHDEAMLGEDGTQGQVALENARDTKLDVNADNAIAVGQKIFKGLSDTFPQKAAILGGDGLQLVLNIGDQVAKELEIDTPNGRALAAGLVLALGHQFPEDPLHPWVGEALTGLTDATERVRSLEAASRRELNAHLDYLGAR